jgi:hypothetical protein
VIHKKYESFLEDKGTSIDNIIAAQKNIPKPKFTCMHCNATVGGKSNLLRWHNDNCKLKEIS